MGYKEVNMATKKQYILVQDNDSHWYVILESHKTAFYQWLSSSDAEDGIIPKWAEEVGGSPSLVKFHNYTIG